MVQLFNLLFRVLVLYFYFYDSLHWISKVCVYVSKWRLTGRNSGHISGTQSVNTIPFCAGTQALVPENKHVDSPTLRKSALLKQNNKEEKEILPLSWHTPALSAIKKLQWKSGISYKTSHNFAKFLKNHLFFHTRKENHGKGHAC